jgi:hypothetical protein
MSTVPKGAADSSAIGMAIAYVQSGIHVSWRNESMEKRSAALELELTKVRACISPRRDGAASGNQAEFLHRAVLYATGVDELRHRSF